MDALLSPAERALKAAVSDALTPAMTEVPPGTEPDETRLAAVSDALAGRGRKRLSPFEAAVVFDEVSRIHPSVGLAFAARETGPHRELGLAAAFLGASSALLESCCASALASGAFEGVILGPRVIQSEWEEARLEIESLRLLAGREALRAGAASDPGRPARLLDQAAALAIAVASLAGRAAPPPPAPTLEAAAFLREAARRIVSSRKDP